MDARIDTKTATIQKPKESILKCKCAETRAVVWPNGQLFCLSCGKAIGHICYADEKKPEYSKWSQKSCLSCGGWDGMRGRKT